MAYLTIARISGDADQLLDAYQRLSDVRDPRRLDVVQQLGISPDRFSREHHEVANHILFA